MARWPLPRPRQRGAAHRARRPDPAGGAGRRGATPLDGARAVDVERDGDRVSAVVFESADDERFRVACRRLVVADGVRSPLGRVLGREWHRDTAYGVAARGYVRSGRSDDEWISSHLELRGDEGELLSGYGWVFPLGRPPAR